MSHVSYIASEVDSKVSQVSAICLHTKFGGAGPREGLLLLYHASHINAIESDVLLVDADVGGGM